MKKLNTAEITAGETHVMEVAARTVREIMDRFAKENRKSIQFVPRATLNVGPVDECWTVDFPGEGIPAASGRTLEAALGEIAERSDAEFMRKRAEMFRQAAAKLDREADEAEGNGTNATDGTDGNGGEA